MDVNICCQLGMDAQLSRTATGCCVEATVNIDWNGGNRLKNGCVLGAMLLVTFGETKVMPHPVILPRR